MLSQVVIYKAATKRDFSGTIIPQDRYSGISTHLYNALNNSDNEKYYQSLDWFNRIF